MLDKTIKTTYDTYVMGTYGRFEIDIIEGNGAKLKSADGTEYIDFASGIGVNSIGYGDTGWVNAIGEQAQKLGHISNLFYSEPCGKLAEMLCSISGMNKVFFSNSGAESNEGAIKLARKYSFDKYGEGRADIITLKNSFHGRTITTLIATGQDHFHNYFFPFTEGFSYAEANDIDALKAAYTKKTCAVMMELVQGEGGVLPLDKDYVKAVEKFCHDNDLILIIDEVQTGIYRTGQLFAFMEYAISPDVVTTAKGLAGGLPIGAILANEKCANVLTAGTHATTFGGNPISSAAAIYVLNKLSQLGPTEISKKGQYIRDKINEMSLPIVKGTRGMGMMIGVIVPDEKHKPLCKKLLDNGLLCITAGNNAIRFLPPLTITYEEIDAGLNIIKECLADEN